MKHKYTAGVRLVEIDSHSLFSRWFSESGKAVVRLFDAVRKLVEMENGAGLVCLLVDEVESLVRCRSTALSGTEPSDSMRAVNALLTQLDKMRRYPNVLMLTTSNMTGAIDNAFADRADLKRYVGPPSEAARYEIYRTSVAELNRVGIITGEVVLLPYETLKLVGSDCSSEATEDSLSLLRVAQKSAGLSGRTLRKIPFLARALHLTSESTAFQDFVTAMEKAIEQRLRDDVLFDGEQTTLNGH